MKLEYISLNIKVLSIKIFYYDIKDLSMNILLAFSQRKKREKSNCYH